MKFFLISLFLFTIFYFKDTHSSNKNFCVPVPFYVENLSNSTFELVTLTVSIKNNSHSFYNTKTIKSTLAISKSNSLLSLFKILTIHRNNIVIATTKEKEDL